MKAKVNNQPIVKRNPCFVGDDTLNSKESEQQSSKVEWKKEVNLLSGVSLMLASIIGSGIFISPKGVMRNAGSVGAGLLIWLGCGVLATFGALSYAEVGTIIPKSGGEFPILLEAFGPLPAFFFAWTSGAVLRPSSLALLSLTFAKYSIVTAYPVDCGESTDALQKFTAVAVIMIVVLVNLASVRFSTKFVTLFSCGQVIGLSIIIVGGIVTLCQGNTQHFQNAFDGEPPGPREVALAFYQGLWAFDGWSHLNYVIEEVKNPMVNLPKAVMIVMALVTGLYLLTNVAYLSSMSLQELLDSPAVGATFGNRVLGGFAWIIPVAVCWSVFGTCLGTCFTAGRIYHVAAREGQFTKLLAMLHVHRNTPAPAILLNGFVATMMVVPNDFDTLIDYFIFSMWIFHGSTCAALLYFRYKLPNHPRPIKVPIFIPIIVLLCAICLVLVPIIDDPQIQYLYVALFILSGLIFYIPFVHFGYKSDLIARLSRFFQKLLLVTLPDDDLPE